MLTIKVIPQINDTSLTLNLKDWVSQFSVSFETNTLFSIFQLRSI